MIRQKVFSFAFTVMMMVVAMTAASQTASAQNHSLLGIEYGTGRNVYSNNTNSNCYGTPYARGNVLNAQRGQIGTWEAYQTSSNAYGYWIRAWVGSDRLRTVTPFRTNSDGSISLWFIEYQYNVGNPCDTKYWIETYSGQVVLYPSTLTANSLSGYDINIYQTMGYQKVQINDQWRSIILTW